MSMPIRDQHPTDGAELTIASQLQSTEKKKQTDRIRHRERCTVVGGTLIVVATLLPSNALKWRRGGGGRGRITYNGFVKYATGRHSQGEANDTPHA